jgi:hypothetical protein
MERGVSVVVSIVLMAAALLGQAETKSAPVAFKAGDHVLIVRGTNESGLVPTEIAVTLSGKFVHVANPTRAKITDGRLRKTFVVMPREGTPEEKLEKTVMVERPGVDQRVVMVMGPTEFLEVEIVEGPLKGAKVLTNAAPNCLKRDVPGKGARATRLRRKIAGRH